MATIHFRGDQESEEYERVFVTESGWGAVTTEIGSKHVDDEGHVLQEPELLRRQVVELEIN